VPKLPTARLDPEVVFLVFVPPLVYRAALTTSWRDFRDHLRSIVLLAVGLVLVTILTIAVAAPSLCSRRLRLFQPIAWASPACSRL